MCMVKYHYPFLKEGEIMNDNEENDDYFADSYSKAREESKAMKKKAMDARNICWKESMEFS